MSSSKVAKVTALVGSVIAATALALPVAASALQPPKPKVSTGGASHVLGTSALLTAVIDPNGVDTSYYFKYGPTTAYGMQTPLVNVGAGTKKIRVGQAIAGLAPGVTYHFRVIGVAAAYPPIEGRDHTFKAKGSALAFNLQRVFTTTYGSPFILSGSLTGLGSVGHGVSLEASPYPFLEAFTSIGAPAVTNAAGAFSFRVGNLRADTQFRLATVDPLPLYSRVVVVDVHPRVVFHVASSKQTGFVRLYGTITPAIPGSRVSFQVQKMVRPGKKEITQQWVTQFSTSVAKGVGNSSRFSVIERIHHGGRYRAYAKVKSAALTSGAGPRTVVLHAAPASTKG